MPLPRCAYGPIISVSRTILPQESTPIVEVALGRNERPPCPVGEEIDGSKVSPLFKPGTTLELVYVRPAAQIIVVRQVGHMACVQTEDVSPAIAGYLIKSLGLDVIA